MSTTKNEPTIGQDVADFWEELLEDLYSSYFNDESTTD